MTYEPQTQEEADFLASYNPAGYPFMALTSDIVVLTVKTGKLSVLLIKRGGHPYKGSWALPGGFVQEDMSSEGTALKELVEETGISLDLTHVEQLKTYSEPDRDPRMRVVSTAYLVLLPNLPQPIAGDDAAEARFFPVEDVLYPQDTEDTIHLAFDHEVILKDGVERAANKLEYTALATTFLPDSFTLADLRRVYEEVWGIPLHAANFRRKILSTPGLVVPIGEKGTSRFENGRSAELYRKGDTNVLQPAMLRSQLTEDNE